MQSFSGQRVRFNTDERGGVSVFSLFMTLTFLIVGGIAIDTAHLIAERTKLQVAADSAAHAAMYYRQSMDEDEAISKALLVAQGTLPASGNPNAIRAEDVQFGTWDGSTFTAEQGATDAVLVNTGKSAARGEGIATYLLKLAGVPYFDVETSAIYTAAGVGGCIYALDQNGDGVSLSGGTSVSAAECAVLSNADVTTPCGTSITTARLVHEGIVDDCQWSDSIVTAEGEPSPRTQRHSPDPMADNAQVAALHARFADIRLSTWPDPVSVDTGTSINFGWSDLSTSEENALDDTGCAASRDGASWTVICIGSEVNLGGITTGGGIAVDFNTGGATDTVYNFSGTVTHTGGSSLRFGSGTFNIEGGVSGADIRFGAGSFHIGTVSYCRASICIAGGGEIVFDGLGDYILDSGISISGGGTLTLGEGANANSYILGENNQGVSMTLNGSAWVEFGDAIGVPEGFRAQGEMNATGGGSCVIFPATANHDLSEGLDMSGAAIFGAGTYHIDGSVRAGTGGADCDNSYSIQGTDVTVVISGRGTNMYGGNCHGDSFCVGGGNAVSLVAPTSGENAFLGVIGPIDESAGGAMITAGGAARLSGVMYFPYAPIEMSGGGSLAGSSSDCLQIIGSEIEMHGGATAASECIEMPGGGRMALAR